MLLCRQNTLQAQQQPAAFLVYCLSSGVSSGSPKWSCSPPSDSACTTMSEATAGLGIHTSSGALSTWTKGHLDYPPLATSYTKFLPPSPAPQVLFLVSYFAFVTCISPQMACQQYRLCWKLPKGKRGQSHPRQAERTADNPCKLGGAGEKVFLWPP